MTSQNNKETFSETKIKVYNFNTTWCGYSKKFQPIWDNFTKSLKPSDNIVAIDAKCDDDKYNELMEKYDVEGFPTVVIVIDDKNITYSGPRTVNGLRSALNLLPVNEPKEQEEEQKVPSCGAGKLVEKPKIKMYNFNTTWCGYSKRFAPVWDEFTKSNKNPSLEIINAVCDDDDYKELCEKYNVEGYPTVVKVNGSEFKQYEGPRTVEGLTKFANENN